MNILIIGSGAREHAILWKLLQSPKVSGIWVAPGNAGTGIIARNLDISTDDFPAIARAVSQNGIDLVVVGPEVPLSKGIVDYLEERGIPTFGPTQAAARIESSKDFAKELMLKHGIPCDRSETFDAPEDARAYIRGQPLPVVVKADGLAAGKGVVVATTLEEADLAIEVIMEQGAFGEAGDRVVVEEFMEGYEVSLLAFTDGETVVPMVPAQDFKRVHDGDQGPNTGGMGSYSPPSFFGLEMVDLVMRTILEPAVRAMAQEGVLYKGVLYAGLMMTAEGPKVV
ncbi:MAG: Phosphoribosylamine--glycine ligase, partial [Dehalococcoidia bacterium]|nr:Phosphoribosylamine--glycine ligase [Dehalococcoidia bacterium]